MQLALRLIEALIAKFQREKFHDEYRERVQGVKHERPERVVNILDALQKSLESQSKGKAAKQTKAQRRRAA